PHAMVFDGHRLAQLDPDGLLGHSPKSRAYALNNRGDIVGSYNDASGMLHGYVLRHGTVTPIDDPGGAPTEAYGINDLGDIIGVTYDADGNAHAFTLKGGTFAPADVPGSFSTIPLGINDRGDIVGEDIEIPGTVGHGFRDTRAGTVTLYDA